MEGRVFWLIGVKEYYKITLCVWFYISLLRYNIKDVFEEGWKRVGCGEIGFL